MRIEIFNVGHGQCAVLTAPNGRRMTFDCGDRRNDDRFCMPSLRFVRETIDPTRRRGRPVVPLSGGVMRRATRRAYSPSSGAP
jgi:hypothetical protein